MRARRPRLASSALVFEPLHGGELQGRIRAQTPRLRLFLKREPHPFRHAYGVWLRFLDAHSFSRSPGPGQPRHVGAVSRARPCRFLHEVLLQLADARICLLRFRGHRNNCITISTHPSCTTLAFATVAGSVTRDRLANSAWGDANVHGAGLLDSLFALSRLEKG